MLRQQRLLGGLIWKLKCSAQQQLTGPAPHWRPVLGDSHHQSPLQRSCLQSIGSIGGTTIFQGQQYSSCSKAGGCRAALLLGGFRRDSLIVSWVAPTPGCTANFPGNRCSQPLILRPFGKSGQELPLEYQVEPLFINFSLSTTKKAIDRSQDLEISRNT
jgi:hypothetical protein